MGEASGLIAFLAACAAMAASDVPTRPVRVLQQWQFDRQGDLEGWMPNSQILSPRVENGCLRFRAVGGDPQILSAVFGPIQASNRQVVEIKLRCDGGGFGQLFFTNTTKDPYSGLRPYWVVPIRIARPGEQVVRVYPFWASLGKIIRLRFDPPEPASYEVDWIRIVEDTSPPAPRPDWDFSGQDARGWQAVGGVRSLKVADGALLVEAAGPGAILLAPVADTPAEAYAMLHLQAEVDSPETLTLYWATTEQVGLRAAAIGMLPGVHGPERIVDLRQFADWSGTITHLGIGFASKVADRLAIRRLSLRPVDPDAPNLSCRYFGPRRAINRPRREMPVELWLVSRGKRPIRPGKARLVVPKGIATSQPVVEHGPIEPARTVKLAWTIRPEREGRYALQAEVAGQTFRAQLRIDPPVRAAPAAYVPVPRPIKTTHEIGAFYFPGWSPDQWPRWQQQQDFPERRPVLGFYREGEPAVADWHIKWAVENGISFFIYDWYWRDGRIALERALHEGYLRARYRNLLKFCIMWANHEPYASHTLDQLLTVADYWIEHYFRRPDYYTVDGRPLVMFFTTAKLRDCLGSVEKVREALDAMRARTRQAGLKPIYFVGCAGISKQAKEELRAMGFDALGAYNYPSAGALTKHSPYELLIDAHRQIWQQAHEAGVIPYIPTLTVGWDSRPWHGSAARVRFGRTTAKFQVGLENLKAFLDRTHGRIGILEAWNEWGEGSYIEPNAEFGFGDLEAIRRVFGLEGPWPVNVAPSDVGLGGYEIALPPGEQGPTGVVKTASLCPHVVEGLQIECRGRKLVVRPGKVRLNGKLVHVKKATLYVEPADTVAIDNRRLRLTGGAVKKWKGGNRLTDTRGRPLLPGSLAGYSLLLRAGADRFAVIFEQGRDYRLDAQWGAFELTDGGRLRPGRSVLASYVYGLRRIDAIQITPDGTVTLRRGEARVDCPLPAAVDDGAIRLANVYRPYHARTVEPEHIYVIACAAETGPGRGGSDPARFVPKTLRKLQQGQAVTIVCWGDSVTVGGDASRPEMSYVRRFEAELRKRFGKASIRVINAGVGGSNSSQRLERLDEEVLSHHPDLITVEFVNDMGFGPDIIRRNYTELVSKARRAGAEVIFITPHFTMPAWMGHRSSRGPDRRRACQTIRELAGELHVGLADVAKRWEHLEQAGLPYETLLKNGINHPDDRGHWIFVEELMRFFPAGR